MPLKKGMNFQVDGRLTPLPLEEDKVVNWIGSIFERLEKEGAEAIKEAYRLGYEKGRKVGKDCQ